MCRNLLQIISNLKQLSRYVTFVLWCSVAFIIDTDILCNLHSLILHFVVQEAGEGIKEPKLVVYEDKDFGSVVSYSSSENQDSKLPGNARDSANFAENNGGYYCECLCFIALNPLLLHNVY